MRARDRRGGTARVSLRNGNMRESRRRDGDVVGREFIPPHCPNRHCMCYTPTATWRAARDGTFTRPSDGERFQCFRCRLCGRRFSFRTFQADYWLRRRGLFPSLLAWAVEGPGLRQSGRRHGVSADTVARHIARGFRQAMLRHRELTLGISPRESLALDGIETFEYSQYFPFHLNLIVGRATQFIWGFTESPLRRKGRMTETQRTRRDALEADFGRPDPGAVSTGIAALLCLALRHQSSSDSRMSASRGPASSGSEFIVHTDGHPAYRRPLREFVDDQGRRIRHLVTPGKAPRTRWNPLFAVNAADTLLRHAQANHRRETIAFSKRRQGALERAGLFLFWRNYIKSRSERVPGPTAAMAAGVVDRELSWQELLSRRRFPRAGLLPQPLRDYYCAWIYTPALGPGQRVHRLIHAF